MNDFVGRMAAKNADRSWVILRILAAAMFMSHGYDKLFSSNAQPVSGGGLTDIVIGNLIYFPIPFDINALFIAGMIEFFGGLLVLIGLWTHIAALSMAGLMAMAYLTTHLAWFPTWNGGELAALYFVTFLVIFCLGPGPYSADSWLASRRVEKRKARMENRLHR